MTVVQVGISFGCNYWVSMAQECDCSILARSDNQQEAANPENYCNWLHTEGYKISDWVATRAAEGWKHYSLNLKDFKVPIDHPDKYHMDKHHLTKHHRKKASPRWTSTRKNYTKKTSLGLMYRLDHHWME